MLGALPAAPATYITAMRRYGTMGDRLYHLSRGEDRRSVSTDDQAKSISAETTFDTDIRDAAELERLQRLRVEAFQALERSRMANASSMAMVSVR